VLICFMMISPTSATPRIGRFSLLRGDLRDVKALSGDIFLSAFALNWSGLLTFQPPPPWGGGGDFLYCAATHQHRKPGTEYPQP